MKNKLMLLLHLSLFVVVVFLVFFWGYLFTEGKKWILKNSIERKIESIFKGNDTIFFSQNTDIKGELLNTGIVPVEKVWLKKKNGQVCYLISLSDSIKWIIENKFHCSSDWVEQQQFTSIFFRSSGGFTLRKVYRNKNDGKFNNRFIEYYDSKSKDMGFKTTKSTDTPSIQSCYNDGYKIFKQGYLSNFEVNNLNMNDCFKLKNDYYTLDSVIGSWVPYERMINFGKDIDLIKNVIVEKDIDLFIETTGGGFIMNESIEHIQRDLKIWFFISFVFIISLMVIFLKKYPRFFKTFNLYFKRWKLKESENTYMVIKKPLFSQPTFTEIYPNTIRYGKISILEKGTSIQFITSEGTSVYKIDYLDNKILVLISKEDKSKKIYNC